MALDFQTVHLPFTEGLDNKTQGQVLDPPGLSRALNVEFDEAGGLRLRKPYASVGANIHPSGTLSNLRKLARLDDELLAFTSTALYSWSSNLSKWVSRGEHLAINVEEATRFGNPTDQVFADRAELGGLIVYVWTEVAAGSTLCYLAAIDATTHATIIDPTSFGPGRSRPRVIAGTNKFFVLWERSGTGLEITSITPATPSFSTTGATLVSSKEGTFDAVYNSSLADCVGAVTNAAGTAYTVFAVNEALAVRTADKARDADLVAVAVYAGSLQVVRYGSATTQILGDWIDEDLLDVTTGTLIASPVFITGMNQLTCAFRTVADGGQYRCYVFWSQDETVEPKSTSYNPLVGFNYIDTAGSVGTAATFARGVGIASRAFDHNGQVYVNLVFARQSGESDQTSTTGSIVGVGTTLRLGIKAQWQNSCFLFRDDQTIHAKSLWHRAAGYGYYTNHLPGVALVSGTTGYAWCGVERQTIAAGVRDFVRTYGARAPHDVLVTFDSDEARRTIQLGRTLYVTGGQVLQYDGEGLAEVGFDLFSWFLSIAGGGAAGSVPNGTYSYKESWSWSNARGERERGTTATGHQITLTGGPDKIQVDLGVCNITRKQGSRRDLAIELWRTETDPGSVDAPYYLVSSKDPAATGDNGYVENDPTDNEISLVDNFTDEVLATKELHPENSGELPRTAPPPATIVAASDARLFLAGVAHEPTRVWYSLLRKDGEVVGFNSALSFAVPDSTGPITAIALWQETPIVFTAAAVYAIPGDGYDNLGGGTNYGPPRLLSTDVGALSHDTVAAMPGGVVFFARKGWYRLSSLSAPPEYIGAKVEDYNSDTWVAAQTVESKHQIRVLSSSRMLVFDYLAGAWAEWSQSGGRDLEIWRGTPMLLDTAVKSEQSTFAAVDYDMDVETGWIKPAQMQGLARVRRIAVLGEYKAAHRQRIRLGYDYQTSAYTDDASMTFSGLTAGNPTQLRQGPSRQRVESIRIRITVLNTSGTTATYDAVTLTGLALEVGLRRGLYPRLPAAQKQ